MGNYNADPNPALSKMRTVAFTYLLAPQPKLKGDQFSTAGDEKVYHLVKKIGSTRIQFLVDPTLIPG